jgi:hypothetical protein
MVNTVRVIAAVLVTLSLCVVGSVPAFADKRHDEGPAGHGDVRVAGDILLIAVGTSIVVDAIQDLGRTP